MKLKQKLEIKEKLGSYILLRCPNRHSAETQLETRRACEVAINE